MKATEVDIIVTSFVYTRGKSQAQSVGQPRQTEHEVSKARDELG